MVARPACDRIDYISKHEKKDNEDERAQKTVFLTEYGKSKVRVGFRNIKIFSQQECRDILELSALNMICIPDNNTFIYLIMNVRKHF